MKLPSVRTAADAKRSPRHMAELSFRSRDSAFRGAQADSASRQTAVASTQTDVWRMRVATDLVVALRDAAPAGSAWISLHPLSVRDDVVSEEGVRRA